jgi:hypothetical protein
MFSVVIQPAFRQRQPVGGVTPTSPRNLSNKMIGLAGSRAISLDFLPQFSIAARCSD